MSHVGPLTGLPADLGLDPGVGHVIVAIGIALASVLLGVVVEAA